MCDFCGLRRRERDAGWPPPRPRGEGSEEGGTSFQAEAAAPGPPQPEHHALAPAPAPAGSPALAGAPAPCARLVVKVQRGEGLLPMDTVLKPRGAAVGESVNEGKPFAETEVRWRSPGDPVWDQSFSVDILHPRQAVVDHPEQALAFLGLTKGEWADGRPVAPAPARVPPRVCDDDPVLRKDSMFGHTRLADRRERQVPVEPKEVAGHMRPAPQFARSLPALDLPSFLGHVGEVKRLLVERLLLRPLLVVLYAISWQSPALSAAVLCWHWLLCYRPRFIWATVWLLVLLCFWHEIPQDGDGGGASPSLERTGVIGGTGQGLWSFGLHAYEGTKAVLTRPLEKAAEKSRGRGIVGAVVGGTAGLFQGTAEGAVGFVTHTGQAVVGLGVGVGGGVIGTLSGLRSPGLAEFQHMIRISPALRDIVRSAQRPAQGAARGLQAVDDLFYWKDKTPN
ncbi:unnamed protein product [Prorocentrum cordatum]|uniref:C2 domain-containing protein n=1 Tax=Prorocentrum cordatum TaxID=2364126 RepID=A0ABN9TSR7_9DINO|nr:unnamed protein product [Polarella glacialis]